MKTFGQEVKDMWKNIYPTQEKNVQTEKKGQVTACPF